MASRIANPHDWELRWQLTRVADAASLSWFFTQRQRQRRKAEVRGGQPTKPHSTQTT